MLLALAFQRKDEAFKEQMDFVSNAYYPWQALADLCVHDDDPSNPIGGMTADQRDSGTLRLCDKALASPQRLYRLENGDACDLPLVEHFHRHFLQRKSQDPPQAPQAFSPGQRVATYWRQRWIIDEPGTVYGTKNLANWNHFRNVVATTARLVQFFSGQDGADRLKTLLLPDELGVDASKLAYPESATQSEDSLRVLVLMLAAFYHDVGKSITSQRHAMEGANLLLRSAMKPPQLLGQIACAHGLWPANTPLSRDWMAHLAAMIMHHDIFGTLSTGENGYLSLSPVLDAVARSGFAPEEIGGRDRAWVDQKQPAQRIWSSRFLLDLWLLNVADVVTSIGRADAFPSVRSPGRKGDDQLGCWGNERTAHKTVHAFFFECASGEFKGNCKSRALLHDVRLGLWASTSHNERVHAGNLDVLQTELLGESAHHVVERISRLVREVVASRLRVPDDHERKPLFDEICRLAALGPDVGSARGTASSDLLYGIVADCIRSSGDYGEFCARAQFIGQMDYALNFFELLSTYMRKRVEDELSSREGPAAPPSYWIPPREKAASAAFNATFFLENLSSLVVGLIRYLLFRTDSFNRLTNLQFRDASERLDPRVDLNDELKRDIVGLSGPYRASRTRELILRTVLFW